MNTNTQANYTFRASGPATHYILERNGTEFAKTFVGIPGEQVQEAVAALNSHAALVGALRSMVERMERTEREKNLLDKAITDRARSALALAKGGAS